MASKVPWRGILVGLLVASVLLVGPPVRAAFPGRNGRIAFSRTEGLYAHIWSMEPDGTGQTQLTFGSANDRAPTWSPDGSRILFLRVNAQGGQGLMVMNADGSGQRRITRRAVQAYFGSWSPGGYRLVFTGPAGACLDIMNVDGTRFRRLLCNGFSISPAWSPLGDVIVFSYVPLGGSFNELWTIKPDGSGLRQLTFGPVPDGSPDWSPDGSHIAFDRSGYPTSDIYVIEADGSNLVDLTAGAPTDVNSWPAYSPDGTLIAYDGSQSGIFGTDIYVMDSDGSNVVQLTSDGQSGAPDWQPLP
jgi:Tol biopolymer transport system component